MEVLKRGIVAPQKLTPRKKAARALIITGAGALIATKLYMLFFYLDPILGIYSFLTTFLVFSSFIVSYTMYRDPVYGKKKDSSKNAGGAPFSAREPLVSVIIPAKNDPVMIIEAAKSCLASTYSNIEVIMVNDGSTDDTGHAM